MPTYQPPNADANRNLPVLAMMPVDMLPPELRGRPDVIVAHVNESTGAVSVVGGGNNNSNSGYARVPPPYGRA